MRSAGFRDIIRKGVPYPTIYVKGLAKEIDHIHGENIITKDGFKYHYAEVARQFYVTDLPLNKVEAINLELLERYQFGNEKQKDVIVELSKRFGISEVSVERINERLTIKEFTEFINNRKNG